MRQTKYEEALYDLVYDPGERCNLAERKEYKYIMEGYGRPPGEIRRLERMTRC